jgi:pimeloyl-ACP methyl ester carboxylesterase
MEQHRPGLEADFGIRMLPDPTWTGQLFDLMDTLNLEQVDLVGNSFGGAVALAAAISRPERVRRLVLCGSVGVPFPITPGLDAVWGYEPGVENMKRLLDFFAFDGDLITDELVELRYRASIEPGFQSRIPACSRRQGSVGSMPWRRTRSRSLGCRTKP